MDLRMFPIGEVKRSRRAESAALMSPWHIPNRKLSLRRNSSDLRSSPRFFSMFLILLWLGDDDDEDGCGGEARAAAGSPL